MDAKKKFVNAALSGLVAGSLSLASVTASANAAEGECHNVNSCKGKGACKGDGHDCAGKNSCKGKGFMKMTEEDCKKHKGSFKK